MEKFTLNLNEVCEKFKDYVGFDVNDVDTKNLIIDYNEKCIIIKSDKVLYMYHNIKGFTPFDFSFYETIYLQKEVYDQIHFEKNSKFLYQRTLICKNGKEFLRLDYVPRTKAENYQDFTMLLGEIKCTGKKRTLLLHSCCGPCSSYCLEYLINYFNITIFYSNSNIDSLEEFQKRVETQRQIIAKGGFNVEVVVDDYVDSDYYSAIKGKENLGEFSKRCYKCYEFRLDKTFKYAKEHTFDFVSTTLSISPYKNSNWINEIGLELQKRYNLSFLYSNFKLNDGYKKSIELSKKYHLYRQDYCGCIFSKNHK